MRVLIQALSVGGHSQLARAGRFWPVDGPVTVEVLDQDDDPTPIMIDVKNAITGVVEKEPRPDPLRMGKRSYAMICADKRLRVLQDGQTADQLASAEVAAARALVVQMSGQLTDANVAIAGHKDRVQALETQIADLTAANDKLAEMYARIADENETLNKLLAEAGPVAPATAAAVLPPASEPTAPVAPVSNAQPASPAAPAKSGQSKPAAKGT